MSTPVPAKPRTYTAKEKARLRKVTATEREATKLEKRAAALRAKAQKTKGETGDAPAKCLTDRQCEALQRRLDGAILRGDQDAAARYAREITVNTARVLKRHRERQR
jgi:hypothetical protein